jgi:hypothetical protein
MWTVKFTLLCVGIILVFLYIPTFAYDYNVSMEELSHLDHDSLLGAGYITSWYDPDSNNYFVLKCCCLYGTSIIKTTDRENPVRIVNFVGGGGCHQDVEVIGDYAYVATFTWYGYGIRNLYILPLQSEYPYFDSSNVVTIPFSDSAVTAVGSTCDTIPLLGDHTLFATDKYLYICEAGIHDDYKEIAILDVSSNPTAPILAGLIDITDVEVGFDGAHSVCVVEDTVIYSSEWWRGIYRLVVAPDDSFNVTSWGKILYDSWRRDVGNDDPLLGQYEDSLWIIDYDPNYDPCGTTGTPDTCWIHYVRPASHSNYVAPNGYLLACDEGAYGHHFSNQEDTVAAILRVFSIADFDTLLDTVTVYDAFDVIWDDSEPYLKYSVSISEMDGATWPAETPMPDYWDCDPTEGYCYMGMGIHDVTVVGRLGLVAYYQYGTHILDVSDPTALEYRGGIAHSLAPNDDVDHDAYAVCMDDAGYIYQSGSSGLYIYRYGETGSITASDASFSNDVYIYDTLTVASGAKLTLNAGTHVYMFEDALLKIDGTLRVNGTSSDSVKFFALGGEPGPGSWQGIYINNDAACTLSYCSIINADNGIEMRNDSEVKISNSYIKNCDIYGIYNYKGYLTLVDSDIVSNGICGLYGLNACDSVLNTNFDRNDTYGIRLSGTTSSSDASYLFGNIITHTIGENESQYGILIEDNDYVNVDSCKVKYHNQGGIKIDDCDPTIVDCDLIDNVYYGIYAVGSVASDISETVFDSTEIGFKTLTGSTPNFGTHPDTSNNAFYTIDDYFIYFANWLSTGSATLKAENCWWGSSSPNPRKFYVDDSRYRKIDYNPYLTSDPAPKLSTHLPIAFKLNQNYPNPFNAKTRISFTLATPAQTTVSIYNILGQKTKQILDKYLLVGDHVVEWDGTNTYGNSVASGIYFYTIRSGDNFASKKMLLLR